MDLKNLLTETYQIKNPNNFWNDINIQLVTIEYDNKSQVLIGIDKNNRNIIFQFSKYPKLIIEVKSEFLFYEITNKLELKQYQQRKEGERTITTRFVTYLIDRYNESDMGFHLTNANIIIRSKSFPENTYQNFDIDLLISEVENRLSSYQY